MSNVSVAPTGELSTRSKAIIEAFENGSIDQAPPPPPSPLYPFRCRYLRPTSLAFRSLTFPFTPIAYANCLFLAPAFASLRILRAAQARETTHCFSVSTGTGACNGSHAARHCLLQ